MSAFASVKKKFCDLAQDHIFTSINDEPSTESKLFQQISSMDLEASLLRFENADKKYSLLDIEVEPVNSIDVNSLDDFKREEILFLGENAIQDGSVAALILSGGQGTRLGFPGPKGMYSIGLPSKKTIFQLHIERIIKIRELCKKPSQDLARIPVYIMTSDLNDGVIRSFFQTNEYFGYPQDDVIFFQQGLEPCLTFDKKLILESSDSLAMNPDGNGGVFSAMKSTGILDDMTARGIQHLHIYGIDNILTKPLDPLFIGLCILNDVQCGNKVVRRININEKVGLSVKKHNKMMVLEYSEIPTHLAEAVNADGSLLLNAANICNHYFSVSFLRDILLPQLSGMYHKAIKKIPYYDPLTQSVVNPSQPNGVKLELFIFDAFVHADRWVVIEARREDEFAPVKNEPGNSVDSPNTARVLLSRQGKRWLQPYGVKYSRSAEIAEGQTGERADSDDAQGLLEISPLVSYAGEGLEAFTGTTLSLPRYISP